MPNQDVLGPDFRAGYEEEINYTNSTGSDAWISEIAGQPWPFKDGSPLYISTHGHKNTHVKAQATLPPTPPPENKYYYNVLDHALAFVTKKSVTVP
jgi:hypothetical protein